MLIKDKKLLFVIQGEGRGHLSQAIAVKQIMDKQSAELCLSIIGKSPFRILPDYVTQALGPNILTIESPNLVRSQNDKSVRIGKSIFYNLLHLFKYLKSIRKIKKAVDEHKPDLILNFYEPLLGLYKYFYNDQLPTVAISHQNMFLLKNFSFFSLRPWQVRSLKILTRISCIRANRILALHFEAGGESSKIKIIPPLLREEILHAQSRNMGHICVYLLNHGYAKQIEKWHRQHQDLELQVFWDKKNAPPHKLVNNNLSFRRLHDQHFMESLIHCRMLISTAGFESVCEAAYLGKQVHMIPVNAHFEQKLNALMFTNAGIGSYSDNFEIDTFDWNNKAYAALGKLQNWFLKSEELFLNQIKDI